MKTEQEPRPFSLKRHNRFHHPKINGREIEITKYLTLPFLSSVGKYDITEGWMYSRAEKAVHGGKVHGAIDFHVPYGTTVVAPCDGLAISSYHSFPIKDENEETKMLNGRELYFGLGYFIQIYISELGRYIQLGHLSEVDDSITFSLPKLENGVWNPTNHTLKPEEMVNNPVIVRVKRGQVLGKVGFSGLRWGYNDYEQGLNRPIPLDISKHISYDEPHLHFEEMGRDKTGKKGRQRDPYDIYLTARNYPTITRSRVIGEDTLFIIGKDGLPVFSDQA